MGMSFGCDEVLVTGAAGWLGRGLLNALLNGMPEIAALREPSSGVRVRALELPGVNTSAIRAISDRVEVYEGDLRNPEDCERFCAGAQGAILFHLAGIIHPRRVRQYFEVNVEAAKNLLEAASEAGVRRAVLMSSNSPCGCNPDPQHRFCEESPYRPYMNYGRSKMLMEMGVRQVQKAERIETVVVRGTWFYGPFQPPRQTLFFRMIRDGKAPIVGSGDNMRSMSYIGNVAQGLLLAAMSPRANGQTYWIADERPYTMNEIVDTVERLLETEFGQECKHGRLKLPAFFSKTAWLCDWLLQGVGLYHQKIHVLSEMNKNIACTVAKAKRELGYKPSVSLEEGMRRSLRWMFESGSGI